MFDENQIGARRRRRRSLGCHEYMSESTCRQILELTRKREKEAARQRELEVAAINEKATTTRAPATGPTPPPGYWKQAGCVWHYNENCYDINNQLVSWSPPTTTTTTTTSTTTTTRRTTTRRTTTRMTTQAQRQSTRQFNPDEWVGPDDTPDEEYINPETVKCVNYNECNIMGKSICPHNSLCIDTEGQLNSVPKTT